MCDCDFIDFDVPDFREIAEDGRRLFIGYEVKHNGKWRIHQNDQDDIFPSDFHAHRIDQPEKLDIYTGNVYSAVDRRFLYTLPKKAMRYIYNELMDCRSESIINNLRERDRFFYLN